MTEVSKLCRVDIEETISALRTQYQIRGDAIVPRASLEAPTIEQLGLIRTAHLNILPILGELLRLKKEKQDENA